MNIIKLKTRLNTKIINLSVIDVIIREEYNLSNKYDVLFGLVTEGTDDSIMVEYKAVHADVPTAESIAWREVKLEQPPVTKDNVNETLELLRKYKFLENNGWVRHTEKGWVKKAWLTESQDLGIEPHLCPNWYRSETLDAAYRIAKAETRANGYYWVKFNAKHWAIAEWYEQSKWCVGEEVDIPLSDIIEINETRIIPPDEINL